MTKIETPLTQIEQIFETDPETTVAEAHESWRKILNGKEGYSKKGALIFAAYLGLRAADINSDDAKKLIEMGLEELSSK